VAQPLRLCAYNAAAIPLIKSPFSLSFLCVLRVIFAPLRELLTTIRVSCKGAEKSVRRKEDRILHQIDTLKARPYDRYHNATEEFPCRGQAG
jgi:hypothetical protein